MDLCVSAILLLMKGFPRTRGDGPDLAGLMAWLDKFPPHARGWTRILAAAANQMMVSPARAGMDRRLERVIITTTGFPRTRGDGPPAESAEVSGVKFPPHARGWTVCDVRQSDQAPVSPARAGMDLRRRLSCASRMGFPRTRGDGPDAPFVRRDAGEFPPHARGWTLAHTELLASICLGAQLH